MKTRTLIAIVITVLSLAATQAFAQSKPADSQSSDEAIQKAVLETNAKMTAAANSLNVDAFFEYILDSDKCVIIQNGTVFKTRQEALEAVKRGFLGLAKMDRRFENPQVTVISPETALLSSEGTYSATLSDGRTMDGRFAVSLVFVRRAGQWKVLHGHYSMPARQQ
jgi:ketosteroid isomerase-like protein